MKDKSVHKRQATHKKDKERFHDLQEQQAQATCSQHRGRGFQINNGGRDPLQRLLTCSMWFL